MNLLPIDTLYSVLVKTLNGFRFLLFLSKVISVLLDFRPMAVGHQNNQINEFRSEILPIYRSNDSVNVLKVSAKKDIPFSRY